MSQKVWVPYWGQGPEFKHSGNCWETKQLSNSLECFNSLAGLREKQKTYFVPMKFQKKTLWYYLLKPLGKIGRHQEAALPHLHICPNNVNEKRALQNASLQSAIP